MKTFEQAFCEKNRCAASEFRPRLFRASLPAHVVPFAFLLRGLNGRYFDADRKLLHGLGEATTLDEVKNEIRQYLADPVNGTWLRRAVKMRVSTRRLLRLSRNYVPDITR